MPVECHASFVIRQRPGQNFHQRAFAGAIAADQPVNFAAAQCELDPIQGGFAAKAFANAAAFQKRCRGGWAGRAIHECQTRQCRGSAR